MKKGTILLTILALVIALVISWAIAVTQKSKVELQTDLLDRAKDYIGDKVYVLAAPLLEEALGYKTDRSSEVETLLKEVYTQMLDQAEYQRKYTDLLEAEMAADDVSEDIFLEAANYYESIGKNEKLIEVLRSGAEKISSDILTDAFERVRYLYRTEYNVYEDVTDFYMGGLCVKDNGYWGLIDKKGVSVLPCRYTRLSNYYNGRLITVSDDGSIISIDLDGNRCSLLHEQASDFKCFGEKGVKIRMADGWHLANVDFTLIMDTAYEDLGMFSDNIVAAKYGGKWGLVNTSGEWAVEPTYDEIILDSLGRCYSQSCIFARQNGQLRLFRAEDHQMKDTGLSFDDARPFCDGYAAVKKQGKWGFIDTYGELVIDYQYADALSFSDRLAAVKVGDKWGYISLRGELVIPAEFEAAKSFSSGSAPVLTERGWQIIRLLENS